MSIPVKPKKKSDSSAVELLEFASTVSDASMTETTSGHRTGGWDAGDIPSGKEWDYSRKRMFSWLQRLTTISFFNDGDLVRVSDEDAPHLKGFVVGSKQLDHDAGDGTHASDIRIFLRKAKYAFRAGWFDGTQADNANTGDGSVAIGHNPLASGADACAIGPGTHATGQGATAIGANVGTDTTTTASGDYSAAIGRGSQSAGADSCALMGGTSLGDSALSCGQGVNAIGEGSRATGKCGDAVTLLIIANGRGSDAHGYVENGGSIVATGNGSRAAGQALSVLQAIQAVGVCAEAFGLGCLAVGNHSRATGFYAVATMAGEEAHAGNAMYTTGSDAPAPGVGQKGSIHATGNGGLSLITPAGAGHTWTPPDNRSYLCDVMVVGDNRTVMGAQIAWKFTVRISKIAGVTYIGTVAAAQPMTNKFVSYNEAGAAAAGFSQVETGGAAITPFADDSAIAGLQLALTASGGHIDLGNSGGGLGAVVMGYSARIDYVCTGVTGV
jgi:hypothetical protein